MNIFDYYRKVLRVAVTHSLDAAQGVIFVLLILGYLFQLTFPWPAWIAGKLGWTINLASGSVAAYVLGTVVAIRFVMAPVWINRHSPDEPRLRAKS